MLNYKMWSNRSWQVGNCNKEKVWGVQRGGGEGEEKEVGERDEVEE